MKSMFLLAVALAFIGCKNQATAEVKSANAEVKQIAAVSKIETATFTVSGMSCAVMCANKIEKELAALKGVSKATVDFDKKLAIVQYDNVQISPETLVETVEAVAGGKLYKVTNLKTTANKAELFQEKEKTRKERRAERKAKKESDKNTVSAGGDAAAPAAAKSCATSGKKCCAKTTTATTL